MNGQRILDAQFSMLPIHTQDVKRVFDRVGSSGGCVGRLAVPMPVPVMLEQLVAVVVVAAVAEWQWWISYTLHVPNHVKF